MNKQQANNVVMSKVEAKKDMLSMLWPTLGATILYLIPVILLSGIFTMVIGADDKSKMLALSMEQILLYGGLYLLAQILLIAPLYFGLTQYYALRRAGAVPSASIVTIALSSIRLYGKSIGLYLTIGLHSLLWALPLYVVIVFGSVLVNTVLPNMIGWFILFEIVIFGLLGYICMIIRYHCAYALIMENTKLGCWKAVRTAAQTFKGHKRELFALISSFMLWVLLVLLTGGLAMVIVCPYFLMSVYHLFDRIRGVQVKTRPAESKEA